MQADGTANVGSIRGEKQLGIASCLVLSHCVAVAGSTSRATAAQPNATAPATGRRFDSRLTVPTSAGRSNHFLTTNQATIRPPTREFAPVRRTCETTQHANAYRRCRLPTRRRRQGCVWVNETRPRAVVLWRTATCALIPRCCCCCFVRVGAGGSFVTALTADRDGNRSTAGLLRDANCWAALAPLHLTDAGWASMCKVGSHKHV